MSTFESVSNQYVMNRIIRSGFLLFIVAFLAAGCHSEGAPVIGISASKAAAAGSNYVKAVRKAGGVPVIIPITGDKEELAEVLERVDGIIMTGGEDVVPSRYGEEALPELQEVFPERDEFDIRSGRYRSRGKNMPIRSPPGCVIGQKRG